MKNRVTLQVRVPKEVGISILGRLYGGGYITKDQYEKMAGKIDEEFVEREKKKRIKMDKILSRTRRFWGK